MWHEFDKPEALTDFLGQVGYFARVEATGRTFNTRHRSELPLIDGLSLRHLQTTGQRITRSLAMTTSSGTSDQVLFAMRVSGRSTVSTDRYQTQLEAASGLFMPSLTPSDAAFSPGETLALVIDRGLFNTAVGTGTPPETIRGPILQLLLRTTRELSDIGDEMDPTGREIVSEAILDLVGSAVRSDQNRRAEPLSSKAALAQSLVADIRARLSDPELGPDDLARRHHISLRHLHAVFREIGEPPASYIRQRRLALSARLLTDRARGSSITAVAGRSGFPDPDSFSRAFRREFGVSPKDYRAAALDSASSSDDQPAT